MGNQYGNYVMYFLSNLLQKQTAETAKPAEAVTEAYEAPQPFENDETGSVWHREEKLELLKGFCPEAYETACKYGHFIIGKAETASYIGIPGRFLRAEQPARGETGFTLWQPLRGGEAYYEELERMPDELCEQIYGYWIALINAETLAISEVL